MQMCSKIPRKVNTYILYHILHKYSNFMDYVNYKIEEFLKNLLIFRIVFIIYKKLLLFALAIVLVDFY